VVNDPNDGEVTGIGLATGSLTGSRAGNADDPVSGLGTDGINSHFFGAAIEDDLKMFVLKIGDPIG